MTYHMWNGQIIYGELHVQDCTFDEDDIYSAWQAGFIEGMSSIASVVHPITYRGRSIGMGKRDTK